MQQVVQLGPCPRGQWPLYAHKDYKIISTPDGRKETVRDFLNIYLQAIGIASVLGAIFKEAFHVMEAI